MKNETVKTLAEQMSKAFETRTRNEGDDMFVCLKDGSPEWMRELAIAAHGDMMADDWRYLFIQEAIDALADFECEEGEEEEAQYSIEADIYTNKLTGWLHSRNDRISWMDEATEEMGPFKSISDHLMAAQMMEKEEVFSQVLEALRDLVDAQEEEEEADDE